MQRRRRGRSANIPRRYYLLRVFHRTPHHFFTESPSSLPPSLVCLFPAAPSTHNPLTRRVISHFILVSPPHVSFLARGDTAPSHPPTLLSLFTLIPSPSPLLHSYTIPPDIPPLDDVIRISAFPLTNSFSQSALYPPSPPSSAISRARFYICCIKGQKGSAKFPCCLCLPPPLPSLSLSLSLSILLAIGLKWA